VDRHFGRVLFAGATSPQVVAVPFPLPPDPGAFATKIFGDHRTQISELGEEILVDDRSRVWMSEGGGLLCNGAFPNHSRIVMRDGAGAVHVWNIPGDRAEVTGLAWDAVAGRLWFARSGLDAGAAVVSFDPAQVAEDPCTPACFDFSTAISTAGFAFYPLPQSRAYPAKLLLDHDGAGGALGHVWYTEYIGNHVGRVDVATGAAALDRHRLGRLRLRR